VANVTAGNTGVEGSAASGDITLGAPASPATNDIWIACVHSSDQVTHTFTDWTQIVQANGGGTTSRLSVWYFRYAGSTPNLIVGHTAGQSPIGGIKAYVGCKVTGSPVNVAGTIAAGTDGTIECSTITPTIPNCALLVITGAADDNALTALGGDYAVVFEDSSGGTQNCYQTTAGTPDGMVGLFHDLIVPASATGTVTVTQAAADPWAGVLIALEPEQTALNAAAGSYALTGSAGTVVAGRVLSADAETYTLAGVGPTVIAQRLLSLDPETYTLAGSDAALLYGAVMNAGLGEYVLGGVDATLVVGTAGFTMEADPGDYVLSGADPALLVDRLLLGDPGIYLLDAADATLVALRVLSADPSEYVLSGVEAAALATRLLNAESETYLLTGANATTMATRLLSLDPGAYVLQGKAAVLVATGGALRLANFYPIHRRRGRRGGR